MVRSAYLNLHSYCANEKLPIYYTNFNCVNIFVSRRVYTSCRIIGKLMKPNSRVKFDLYEMYSLNWYTIHWTWNDVQDIDDTCILNYNQWNVYSEFNRMTRQNTICWYVQFNDTSNLYIMPLINKTCALNLTKWHRVYWYM